MRKYLYVIAAFVLVVGCKKQDPVSPTDPLPFPMDAKKDLSVVPGDDFFQYCNGTWLKTQPDVPIGAIGSLYDAQGEMDKRVEALKAEVPSLKLFFDLRENMYAQPEASQAYIDAQKARIARPKSYEEAFRTMGAMVMEGVTPFESDLNPVYVDGRYVAYILPNGATNFDTVIMPEELYPATACRTKAGTSVLGWIAEGLGISMDYFYLHESFEPLFETLMQKSLDELYEMMLHAWDSYDCYVSQEALEAYNVESTKDISLADVRQFSRLLISYPLSFELADKYFPESEKQRFADIMEEIRSSLRKRILKTDWMSKTTHQRALEKLDKMKLFVGYPDEWHQEGLPDISGCKTFVEMVHVLQGSQQHLVAKLLGTQDIFTMEILGEIQASDNSVIPADLTLVNACYTPTLNSVLMYPALLLPPCMLSGVSEARIYASFMMIGHEMTHGFDNQGAEYDAEGKKRNWWTVADKMAFQDRQENLVRCYDNLEMDPEGLPGRYGYGERTLGENIADLGGFLTVLDAYKEHLQEQGYFGSAYQDQLRRFYEGYADVWCVKYGRDRIQNFFTTDVHSPARLRVNGVVMNTDLWYDLYGVTRDNKLYLPEERRTKIW